MSSIVTVTGEIQPEKLGGTLMHEHTLHVLIQIYLHLFNPLCDKPIVKTADEETFQKYLGELREFRHLGGKTICDGSACDFRGDIRQIRRLSEESGVQIVACTGMYLSSLHAVRPEFQFSEDEMRRLFLREIREGIDGTDIRPGFVKCALGKLPTSREIQKEDLISLAACARAAREAGMHLQVHTDNTMGISDMKKVLDIAVQKNGLPPEKLLVLHVQSSLLRRCGNDVPYIRGQNGKKLNLGNLRLLLDHGVTVSLDCWGHPFPDDRLVKTLPEDPDIFRALDWALKHGYEKQIVLGHDLTDESCLRANGGHGYTRVSRYVLPKLREAGYGEDVIHTLMVENPQKLLTVNP